MKDTVLLDGAVGTSLWAKTDDKVPVWRYNIEKPEIVSELHREYIEAGSQMILCNTFGANRGAVRGYARSVHDVVKEGVRLCNEAARGTGVKTVLSVGPLMQLLEPYGDMTEEEAEEIFSEQIGAGMEEHPDAIYVQTFMDIELAKVASRVARRYDVPLFCSMTFEPVGKTMMGQSVDDVIAGMSEFSPDAIGLNCSLGPETALPIIKQFGEKTDTPLIFKPNAGKPKPPVGGVSQSDFDAEAFAADVIKAAQAGVKYIGGCCGADPSYIRKLKELLDKER